MSGCDVCLDDETRVGCVAENEKKRIEKETKSSNCRSVKKEQ
jgi:hypothetical protein